MSLQYLLKKYLTPYYIFFLLIFINSLEGDKALSMKDDDNEEKEIQSKEPESLINDSNDSFEIKSSEIINPNFS